MTDDFVLKNIAPGFESYNILREVKNKTACFVIFPDNKVGLLFGKLDTHINLGFKYSSTHPQYPNVEVVEIDEFENTVWVEPTRCVR